MRERLVVAFVALTVAVVGVFLVARGYTTSALIEEQERRDVARSVELLAALLAADATPSRQTLEAVLNEGEWVVFEDEGGRTVEADRRTGTALSQEPTQRASEVVESRPVAGGGTVTLTRQSEVVEARVAEALLPLVLLGLGLLAGSVVVAVVLARRLARPFVELAEIAGQVGRGSFDVEVPRYDVPEADAVGRALKASARDLDVLVRRERGFAVHASHELNTPITAARLELEDLALEPALPPEVGSRIHEALGQLDRLSVCVAGMLDASRASRLGGEVEIDLTALVRDTVQRWRPLAPGRRLVDRCDGVVAVRVPAAAVMQVLDALIGNAVTHGAGSITVSVTSREEYAEVGVADESPREAGTGGRQDSAAPGTGLATAIEIAESLGGRLRLTESSSTTYFLALPLSRRPLVFEPAG